MRLKPAVWAGLCLLTVSAQGQDLSADLLLGRITEALFNHRWQEAAESASLMQKRFPKHEKVGQAIYYEARARESLGQKSAAFQRYEALLDGPQSVSQAMIEGAQFSLIGLAVDLYNAGDRSYIDRALDALTSGRKDLRYYAALRLSYLKDRSLAPRAVPVLRGILREEEDQELHNRAILALMRIDPELLNNLPRQAPGPEQGRFIVLEYRADGVEMFTMRLPVSLTQLLIDTIPEDALVELKRRGINADNLVEELRLLGGTRILELRSQKGLFRISID